MPRATNERKDKTVKLRITEEMYKELESKGDNLSETIREMLKGREDEKGYIRELEIDCKLMGVEVEEFVKMVCMAIDEGEIVYEDGKLVKIA